MAIFPSIKGRTFDKLAEGTFISASVVSIGGGGKVAAVAVVADNFRDEECHQWQKCPFYLHQNRFSTYHILLYNSSNQASYTD